MLANVRQVASLAAVNRFNGQPMVEITAAPAPGVSLVEARALCEAVVEGARKQLKLPEGYRLTWLAPMP
jgi:multidrug efflux pump subunit AcrB